MNNCHLNNSNNNCSEEDFFKDFPICANQTCHGPQKFEENFFVQLIYGTLSPIIIIVTLATNILVCVVLCEKTMRSPTNVLLVAMAISDSVTGLWALPIYLVFYSTGRYEEYVPYNWCYAFFYLADYLPTIFHTISIWLIVCLAGQRYMFVCRPIIAKRFCTIEKTLKTIAIVCILSIVFHATRMAGMVFYPMTIQSKVHLHENVTACFGVYAPIVAIDVEFFFNFYYMSRTIFVNLIPCIFLVLFNVILVLAMNKAAKRRSQLLKQNMRMESKRLEEKNSTTMMLVVVVGIFLLVEVPLAVFFLIVVVNNNDKEFISEETIQNISLFINFFILLSYPLNFFIYCRMSRQFRKSFKKLIFCNFFCKKSFQNVSCSQKETKEENFDEKTRFKSKEMRGKNATDCFEVTTNEVELKNIKSTDKQTCQLTVEENTVAAL